MRDEAGHQLDGIVLFLKADIVLYFGNVGSRHHSTLLIIEHDFILSDLEKSLLNITVFIIIFLRLFVDILVLKIFDLILN